MNAVYALIVVLNPAWEAPPWVSYEAEYVTYAQCEAARDAEIKVWVDQGPVTGLARFGAECVLVTPLETH